MNKTRKTKTHHQHNFLCTFISTYFVIVPASPFSYQSFRKEQCNYNRHNMVSGCQHFFKFIFNNSTWEMEHTVNSKTKCVTFFKHDQGFMIDLIYVFFISLQFGYFHKVPALLCFLWLFVSPIWLQATLINNTFNRIRLNL